MIEELSLIEIILLLSKTVHTLLTTGKIRVYVISQDYYLPAILNIRKCMLKIIVLL